jgi:hypothetical protein
MRYTFLLLLFAFSEMGLYAQEAEKQPLLEHFTNTRCPICGARNPDFHAARENYGDDVLHISYHPSAPYPNCILHQHNPEGNDSRFDYYRPQGTPTVYLDGKVQTSNNMLNSSDVDAALQSRSFFELEVTRSLSSGMLSAEVDVTTLGDVPAGTSYRIYVAAVERELEYNAPNGESTHYNVFRAFLSDREGETFTPAANGSSISLDGSVAIHPDWVEEGMYILAYIENTTDAVIENAGSSLQTTTSTTEQRTPNSFSLFPNPTHQQIQISGGAVARWELYSIAGARLSEGGPLQNRSVSLAGHPAGPYILRLQNGKGEWQTFKVIKE